MTTSTRSAAESAAHGTAEGMTEGAVRSWLRLEGLAAFIAGVALFAAGGGSLLHSSASWSRTCQPSATSQVHGSAPSPTTSPTPGRRGWSSSACPCGSPRQRSARRGDPAPPTSASIERSATASSCRPRFRTPISAAWDGRRRESRAGADVVRRDRGRRPGTARGGRPRRRHDAGRRGTGERPGSVAVQAAAEPRALVAAIGDATVDDLARDLAPLSDDGRRIRAAPDPSPRAFAAANPRATSSCS